MRGYPPSPREGIRGLISQMRTLLDTLQQRVEALEDSTPNTLPQELNMYRSSFQADNNLVYVATQESSSTSGSATVSPEDGVHDLSSGSAPATSDGPSAHTEFSVEDFCRALSRPEAGPKTPAAGDQPIDTGALQSQGLNDPLAKLQAWTNDVVSTQQYRPVTSPITPARGAESPVAMATEDHIDLKFPPLASNIFPGSQTFQHHAPSSPKWSHDPLINGNSRSLATPEMQMATPGNPRASSEASLSPFDEEALLGGSSASEISENFDETSLLK